jgi:hypothetical protein
LLDRLVSAGLLAENANLQRALAAIEEAFAAEARAWESHGFGMAGEPAGGCARLRSATEKYMPGSAARVIGPYRIVPSEASAPSIPPEQKGARYISDKLQSYADAELELTATDSQARAWKIKGQLRVSPSQSFEVSGSMTPGTPARAVGSLAGNKGRTAAFSAVFDQDQLTFSLAYRKEDGARVPVQSFVFKRRAAAVAPAPRDPFAALVEQWTARLRRSRFTLSENAFDRDYSGGGYYQEVRRDLQLHPDGTFRLDDRGFSRVSAGGMSSMLPISRSRTGRWSVTATREKAWLMLSSDAGNELYVLSGAGSTMLLDGRWQRVSQA